MGGFSLEVPAGSIGEGRSLNQDKESDIVQSLEKGADEYIVKPINQKELLSKIGNMLVKAGKNSLPSQFYFKKLEAQQPEEPDAP